MKMTVCVTNTEQPQNMCTSHQFLNWLFHLNLICCAISI